MLLGIILSSLFLRLFWISDMEYKGDEDKLVQLLSELNKTPFSPLSPVAEHSGIAHSSLPFYFLKLISFGSSNPIAIATSIAVANALAIAIGAWLGRKSEKGLFTFLMCATSFNLILGSRKIWTPDLVPIWICLFIGLFLYSEREEARTWKHELSLILSAICIIGAGHMYPPGLLCGLAATGCVSLSFFFMKKKKELRSWLTGCFLGWITWIPYFYCMVRKFPGSGSEKPHIVQFAHRTVPFREVLDYCYSVLTLASPYGSENLYLLNWIKYLKQSDHPILLVSLLAVLFLLTVLWTGIFIFALILVFLDFRLNLRQKMRLNSSRHKNFEIHDPLAILSILVLLGTVLGLKVLGIGNYLHYWFGAMPFAYYLIASALCLSSPWKRPLKLGLWIGTGGSVIAVLLFFSLVRQFGGLPGEYGISYRVLKTQTAR